MDRRLRLFTALSFMLAALFALALAPAWAGGVDEKIQALEQELAQLKAQQGDLKKEAGRATAAAAALPTFAWRGGRGLTITDANKQWRATVNYEAQGQISFFPNSHPKSLDTGQTGGPAQGTFVTRHMETEWNFGMYDELFEVGMDMDWSPSTPRTKSRNFNTHLEKFSPYYPTVRWMHVSVRAYNPVYNSSSSTGTTLERANVMDSQYSTFSTRGIGLTWSGIPLGSGQLKDFALAMTMNKQLDTATSNSSADNKGFIAAMQYQPFSAMKGNILQGWSVGAGYLTDHTDRRRGTSNPAQLKISVGSKGSNDPTIFDIDTTGRHWLASVWTQYSQGPWRLGLAHDWHNFERDFRSMAGSKVGDAEITDLLIRAGYFVWGDENGGLMVAYNHFRNYFDAGSGFATRNNQNTDYRRSHEIKNIVTARYFYKPNIIYTLEGRGNRYDKLGNTDAGTNLGVSNRKGGTALELVFAVKYDF